MLHFDAQAVRNALPWPTLVAALRQAFIDGCEVPTRHPHGLGEAGTVLLMPAWRTGGCLGVKTVTIFPGNSTLGLPGVHASYALFSARTGVPLAVLDGTELTARRTAAASALAASFLAREDSSRLLLVGAGRVAGLLPAAMRSVRPGLQEVWVWARRAEAARALARQLCSEGFDASVADDLASAVPQAHVVSCATMTTQALVQGKWLAPGTHLDLIGGFTPTMREADGICLARSRVFVDTDEALSKAGDLLQAISEGHFLPANLQGTLGTLCRAQATGRRSAEEITLFKSVGSALEDLAAAEMVWRAADNPPHSA
ncbi:MAG: ornithine cyclodeaminase family protein [Rubrivivax sp.]|nr:ornithine cyclodeaminase family protein [Rubrivivax sp.]